MNRAALHEQVHLKVQIGIMNDLIAFVKTQDPGWFLWNRTKENFIDDYCYIFVYKMICATGDGTMSQELRLQQNLPNLRITKHTLNNNLKVLHPIILNWARSHITLGNESDWNKAVADRKFDDAVREVNLWMDSSDFPMNKTRDNRYWYSHKLEGTGIKVQFVTDAEGRTVFIDGPMEPGQYDSHYLEAHKYEFEEKFKGGVIIADSHYAQGEKLFEDPQFLCNLRESAVDKAVAVKENLPVRPNNRKRKAEIDLTTLSEDKKAMSMKRLNEMLQLVTQKD